MPYLVKSYCDQCTRGDEFIIGLWPEHLGVFVCQTCQAVVNIPLTTGQCPGCGYAPAVEACYDYSAAIPYLGGQPSATLDPGPVCPKCQQGRLAFETTSHVNVGRLGGQGGDDPPWVGKDYLEKAIFVNALIAVCAELELKFDDLLSYYNLDVSKSLIMMLMHRRISVPIVLDVRNHLLAVAMSGEASFQVSRKLEETVGDSTNKVLRLFRR